MLTLDHVGKQRQPSTEAFHRALSRRSITYELLTKRNRARIDEDACSRNESPVGSSIRSIANKVRMADDVDKDSDRTDSDVCGPPGVAGQSEVGSALNSHRTRNSINIIRQSTLIDRDRKMESSALQIPMHEAGAYLTLQKDHPDSTDSATRSYDFPELNPIPIKTAQIREAEICLKAFTALAKEDLTQRMSPELGGNRYFYARRFGQRRLLKLKVVYVGPDTAKLSLPAYATRLIKLVKYRRTRLREIENGSCLFRHENVVLLRHDLQVYENALRLTLKMLRDSKLLENIERPNPQVTNALASRVLRPVGEKANMLQNAPADTNLEEFLADVSASGVTDLLSVNSEVTSVLEEEVEELRKSLRRVREDIAYILEEEEDDSASMRTREMPPHLINASRQSSVHTLLSVSHSR